MSHSAFHPSGVSYWVPAIAEKAKAGMAHSDCDKCVGVQVKLWNPLRTRAIPERFWGDDSRRDTISSICIFMPRHLDGSIKRWCCLTSVCLTSVCVSVAYIGPKSRITRPRKTKIGTEVAHVTLYWTPLLRSKGQGPQVALLTTELTCQAAAMVTDGMYWGCESTATLLQSAR